MVLTVCHNPRRVKAKPGTMWPTNVPMEASLQYRDTTQSFKYTSSEQMIVKVNEVHYGNLVKRSVHGACVSTNKNTVKGTTCNDGPRWKKEEIDRVISRPWKVTELENLCAADLMTTIFVKFHWCPSQSNQQTRSDVFIWLPWFGFYGTKQPILV